MLSDAPEGRVSHLREKLEKFAEKHNLVINEAYAWKIEWMANHEGRCACDWIHRKCPCPQIFQDLTRFKGNCLCRVFFTRERLDQLRKNPKKTKLTPLEKMQREELRARKQGRDQENWKRLSEKFKKKGKRLKKIVDF